MKPPASKWFDAPSPLPPQEPLQPDEPAREKADVTVKGDRLPGGDLEIKFQMVLQVLADARPVRDDVDVESAQLGGRPHARELQELRRVDRAGGEDHLPPARANATSPLRR